jgi:hypothetical protein
MLRRLILIIPLIAFTVSAAEPEKLQELRSSYQAAVNQATVPLQQTYIQGLEKLMVGFIKDGRLRDALTVSDEIKKLSPGSRSILKYELTPDGHLITGGFTIAGRIGTLRYSLIPEHLRRAH